jgi:periplasmic protein CpxP/Spy
MENTMKLYQSLIMSSLMGLALSTSVAAGPHHKNHADKKQHKMERTFKALNLSDEQRASVNAVYAEGKDSRIAKHKQMQALKAQLRDLLQAEQLDEGAIKAVSLQMAEEKANMLIGDARQKQQVYALLNAEQKETWDKVKQRRERKRERKMRSAD